MRPDFQRSILEIQADHLSGASEIEVRARALLMKVTDDPGTSWGELLEVGQALLKAQPAMAPVWNAVNEVLLSFSDATGYTGRGSAQALRFTSSCTDGAINHLLPHLESDSRVLTISNSSTVRGTLTALARQGLRLRAFCAEGRPLYEGRRLAAFLADIRGFSVTMMTDAAVYSMVSEVDLVFVGADAVGEAGFINKVGTRALALVCREEEVPFFLLTTRSKWLPAPAWRKFLQLTEEPGDEVWPEAPAAIRIRNPYFEFVPWAPGMTVATESGLLTTKEAVALIRKIKIHPSLE